MIAQMSEMVTDWQMFTGPVETRAGGICSESSGELHPLARPEKASRSDGVKLSVAPANRSVGVRSHRSQPLVLLVEHRDEVFARLESDLTEAGMRVVRAETAWQALERSAMHQPSLVVANVDLPDQSGWLMTNKLQFIDPEIRLWLYEPRTSESHAGLARSLAVDELIEYGGKLFCLSDTIVDLLAQETKTKRSPSCDRLVVTGALAA